MRLCENCNTHRVVLALASCCGIPSVPLYPATAQSAWDGRGGAAEDRPSVLGSARAAAHFFSREAGRVHGVPQGALVGEGDHGSVKYIFSKAPSLLGFGARVFPVWQGSAYWLTFVPGVHIAGD